MKNSKTFEIAYTGNEVNGIMNVKQLAPALLAVGQLIEDTNRIIGNPEAEIVTVVHANFAKGSFHINFDLICNIVDTGKLFIDMVNFQDLSTNILDGLGLIAESFGLFQLIKYLRDSLIKDVTILDNGKMKLQLQGRNGDFDYIEVTEKTMKLYKNIRIREQLAEVIKPIKSSGVDALEIIEGEQVLDSISKLEADYFNAPTDKDYISPDEGLIVSNRKAYVNIEDVPLNQPTLKWKLSEGDNKFWAQLKDDEFLYKIDTHQVSFTKGDILEIEIEVENKIGVNGKVQSDYSITKIYNHVHPNGDISLFNK